MYVLSLKLGSERVMIPLQSNCVQMATPLCLYLEKEESGGGIAIVYRSDITLRSKSVYNYQTMECADFLLDFQNM